LDDLGEDCSSRELGRLVSAAFESDHARMKATIDEHLAAQRAEGAPLPILDPPTMTEVSRLSQQTPAREPTLTQSSPTGAAPLAVAHAVPPRREAARV